MPFTLSPHRSRRCSRADMFRATLNRQAWLASICSAECPSHLRSIVMSALYPPAIHNGSDAAGPIEPKPFSGGGDG